jgi:hypothetical protein
MVLMIETLLILVVAAVLVAAVVFADRKFRRKDSARDILIDWAGGFAGWLNAAASQIAAEVRTQYYALRARGDRDVIRAQPASATVPAPARPAAPSSPARQVSAPPPFAGAPANAAGPAEMADVMDAPVPAVWQPLIQAVTSFEPEDQAEHLAAFSGNAAGLVAYAEAWRAYADTQLHTIGLDPGAVQATLDMADSIGDCAHDVVLAKRAYLVIYQEIIAAIENGLVLPHNARQWLSRDAA